MNNSKFFSVNIQFYYDGLRLLDPRSLTTFKSAITLLRKIPSCSSILFSEEVYDKPVQYDIRDFMEDEK